jgi:phage shock protein A
MIMATKRTNTKQKITKKPAKKAVTKKVIKEKVEAKPQGPRHPAGRVKQGHGGKEALAKALAPALARDDEDTDVIASRLKTASNAQLLRLQRVVDAVKQKWGSREALITALSTTEKKAKDKDFVSKLGSFSLPKLFDLAIAADRRARA